MLCPMGARLRLTSTPTSRRPEAARPALPAERIEDVRAACRAHAHAQPEALQLDHARGVIAHALAAWWRKLEVNARLRPLPISPRKLSDESLLLAERIAELAAELPLDDASFLLGRSYSTMLPASYRSANGVFYTPPAVVDRLLDNVENAGIDWAKHAVLDPACGGGAFIGPVARRMLRALGDADPRVKARSLMARLHGFEIDPFSAWMTGCFTDAVVTEELGELPKGLETIIETGDTLTRPLTAGPFDLVIGNPPYGRLKLAPALRTKFARSLYGHANLYALFLDYALHVARPGSGVVAFVTPTGFLCGEYFKNLRSVLAEEAPLLLIDFVAEREGVFDDVLQETLLAVFRKGALGAAQVSFVDVDQHAVTATNGGTFELPTPADNPWILARSSGARRLAKTLRALPTRLADWGYRVSTGPLVWNRFKERLRDEPEKGTVPLLWAESVSPDGTFEFRAARRNHAPYFLTAPGEDHLLVKRACVLLQRTTAKEQDRRLIAALLPASFLEEHRAVTVENHLNMILPTVEHPAVTPAALAAFLNSAAADNAFRCISGTVAVSAYELEAMPLPSPKALVFLERAIARGASEAVIRNACDALYP